MHIRGEHGNAGYRIDGVMLPEGLAGFGQEFDLHFIASATLLTGALPAQYGLRLSGVVDITTKSGADLNGGEAGVYGGSFGTVRPYFDFGRSAGNLDYFVSFSDLRDGLGIENPTPSTTALHDETSQAKGFGSVRYRIDDGDTLSFLWGINQSRFQIPDTPGETSSFALAGAAPIASAQLNENQSEQDGFAMLAYRLERGAFSLQTAAFYHYNRIRFVPDTEGDLLYQGVASQTSNLLKSGGTEIDASYAPNDRHTFRFGGQATIEGYGRWEFDSGLSRGERCAAERCADHNQRRRRRARRPFQPLRTRRLARGATAYGQLRAALRFEPRLHRREPSESARIRHYGLLASAGRKAYVALARQLLAAPAPAEPEEPAPLPDPRPPCPCCGGRMVVIEIFQRAAQARAPPASPPLSGMKRKVS